jgi:hypothetical protein
LERKQIKRGGKIEDTKKNKRIMLESTTNRKTKREKMVEEEEIG